MKICADSKSVLREGSQGYLSEEGVLKRKREGRVGLTENKRRKTKLMIQWRTIVRTKERKGHAVILRARWLTKIETKEEVQIKWIWDTVSVDCKNNVQLTIFN